MGKQRLKKGLALSLETIAIAAIVLVVLIIILAVFRGGIGKILPSVGKVNDCNPVDCMKQGECTSGQEIYGLGCEKNKDDKVYCCKRSKDVEQK